MPKISHRNSRSATPTKDSNCNVFGWRGVGAGICMGIFGALAGSTSIGSYLWLGIVVAVTSDLSSSLTGIKVEILRGMRMSALSFLKMLILGLIILAILSWVDPIEVPPENLSESGSSSESVSSEELGELELSDTTMKELILADPMAIRWILNPSPDLVILAIEAKLGHRNPGIIPIRNRNDFVLQALALDPTIITLLPADWPILDRLKVEAWERTILKDWRWLQDCPSKYQTLFVCVHAMRRDPTGGSMVMSWVSDSITRAYLDEIYF